MTPEESLERAKLQLMRLPNTIFYTTILFSLVQEWDDTIPTGATNGTHLFINPVWFLDLEDKERIGLLVHELLHVALNHMTRLGDRDPELWNIAADHVINLSMKDADYVLPAGALCDRRFIDMDTEEVYDVLLKERKKDKNKGGAGANGIGIPGGADIQYPKDSAQIDTVKRAVSDIVQKAKLTAEASSNMPGTLPGEMEIALDAVLNPILPWDILLQNYMSGFAKDDYSWGRPNRRYMPNLYLPTAHSETVGEIAEAIDLSCSVGDHEINVFMGQNMIMQETVKPEKITLISFDTRITNIQEITPETDIANEIKLKGRGGTNIKELMEWAKENDPMVLIVFTDGEFHMYPDPGCPVLWLIHNNKRFTAPYGEIIHYEI